MKHELNRLGPDGFEHLIQALMTKEFGVCVKIYGDGPDRQREAVIENAYHTICGEVETTGRTIVQAKFKSPDGKQDDWEWIRKNLKKELDGFAKKAKKEKELLPDTWLFFTNIVLTPGKGGVKDKADAFVRPYTKFIPNIHVLGADEIRSMLDASPEVARSYAAFLTPGDVLKEAIDYLQALKLEKLGAMMEYVLQRFRLDEPVRLEQAGGVSEGSIKVKNVYTDIEAEGEFGGEKQIGGLAAAILKLGNRPHPRGRYEQGEARPAAPEKNLVLIGNAGQGKSTLCQYICQLYRAALLERFCPKVEAAQNYAEQTGMEKPGCERFPVLIRLKDYAAWIKKRREEESEASVLHYLALGIGDAAQMDLSVPDLRELLRSYSWIFFFDGLDEVPASSNRTELFRQIDTFLTDLAEASCDSLVVCTSRPQGYDAAFARRGFRHLKLKEMTPELCRRYMDRLLHYLEQNEDYRKKYYDTLNKALEDPLVAKLMTTPLYTAIIVLLVKSGSTPPTRRYELFREYCEVVQRRELQKELLPSLYEGNYAWVTEVHGRLAYLLQTESETAENAAAELSAGRCRALIHDYLEEECWQGDREAMEEALYRAITERLPFLAETTDAQEESCVLFPLRSLQEYFAAEHLLGIEDAEQRRAMLEALSLSAYWRNVFLFVAGYYSMKDIRTVNDSIYAICLDSNGNAGSAELRSIACEIAQPGSRLALDLLRDNLFERREGQKRYLDLVAKLLEWDFTAASPVPAMLELPPVLLEKLIQKAIGRVRETKNPNEAAFALLCEAARRGNAEAREFLEECADQLSAPTEGAFTALFLQGNLNGLGVKLLHRALAWLTEEFPGYGYSKDNSKLLDACRAAEEWEKLPKAIRREFAYETLQGVTFRIYNFFLEGKTALLELIRHDKLIAAAEAAVDSRGKSKSARWITRIGRKGVSYRFVPPECDEPWCRLESIAAQEGFRELAALAAFCRDRCAERVKELLAAEQELPEKLRRPFHMALRSLSLPLCVLADSLEAGESTEVLQERWDAEYIQRLSEREARIIPAVRAEDYSALNELDAWPYLMVSFRGDEPWLPAVLVEASERSWQSIVSDVGLTFNVYNDMLSPALCHALLQRFPLAFRSLFGIIPALAAFAQEPDASAELWNLDYPREFPQLLAERGRTEATPVVLRRIQEMGGMFPQVYSLLPYVSDQADAAVLRAMAEKAAERFDAVKASGNDCALLGVILLLLTGEVPTDRRDEIVGELRRMMKDIDPSIWHRFSRKFSLEGQLLAHEAGMVAYKGTVQERRFFRRSRCAILRSLEALPAERDKLPAFKLPVCV